MLLSGKINKQSVVVDDAAGEVCLHNSSGCCCCCCRREQNDLKGSFDDAHEDDRAQYAPKTFGACKTNSYACTCGRDGRARVCVCARESSSALSQDGMWRKRGAGAA